MNKIEIRCIRNKPVRIFNPDGSLLCETDNLLQFNDIRIQIKDQKLEGYYLEFEGEKSIIDSNGGICNWMKGLFAIAADQLNDLYDFQ